MKEEVLEEQGRHNLLRPNLLCRARKRGGRELIPTEERSVSLSTYRGVDA